jgi:hypothetical protein
VRNVLAFLAAAALTVVGVGWYLGWYRLSNAPADHGRTRVNIEFDTIKIGEDFQRGGRKVHDLLERGRQQRAAGGQEPAEDATPRAAGRGGRGR